MDMITVTVRMDMITVAMRMTINEGFEIDSNLGVYDYNYSLTAKFDGLDVPRAVEANVPWLQQPAPEKPTRIQSKVVVDDMIDLKFKAFKQFDVVYDHYYTSREYLQGIKTVKKPSKDWVKRIHHEWKVMKKNLPEMIYVRVYEDRMDILRAVIIGAAGTPYHDGLFFFDVYFPPSYPRCPPVLVSIHALVLNAKPYFNEPKYGGAANLPNWQNTSLHYNEQIFLLSCRTMLYTLRKPPKHFEDFVAGYFHKHGRAILVACRAYLCGAQVGCLIGGGVQDVDEGGKGISKEFRNSLKILYDKLLMKFTVKGADCNEFPSRKVRDGSIGAADTTLRARSVTRKRKERKKVGKYEKTKIEKKK